MPAPSLTSPTVESLLRLVSSPAALQELGPGLAITGGVPNGVARSDGGGGIDERIWLAREGFAALRGLVDPATCRTLVNAIEALRARGLPASFIYAFDETWAIGQAVCRQISALLGREYRLFEDIWAWRILPGGGGWPAHRGVAGEKFDREAPEVINAWIALSDVTADRACMHAVPLDDDPGYPDAMNKLDAPLAAVRALPATMGDVLFWNANVLHWGGRCSPRAIEPRVSCSFTLGRADAVERVPDLVLLPSLESLSLAARMDAVARMILVYGGPDRDDVSAATYEWAKLTHALAERFARPRPR